MPVEFHDMENETVFDRLTLALIGAPQSGKSRTAATCRKPALVFDFDKKVASIAGTKGLYAMTFQEDPKAFAPTSYQEAIDVMRKLEQNPDLSQFGFQNCPPGTLIKTLVGMDSVQSFSQAANRYALAGNKDLRRTIQVNTQQVYFNNGWDAVNAEGSLVMSILDRMFALHGAAGKLVDLIIILHETDEEDPRSTSEHPIYTGRKMAYPKRYGGDGSYNLLKNFANVWRIALQNNCMGPDGKIIPGYSTVAKTKPSFDFNSGTTLNIDEVEPRPNIEQLIAKHISRQGK